jgi:hypothetical protein
MESLRSIILLVFVMEMRCVFCEVGNKSQYYLAQNLLQSIFKEILKWFPPYKMLLHASHAAQAPQLNFIRFNPLFRKD